jgi:hypothetical protein
VALPRADPLHGLDAHQLAHIDLDAIAADASRGAPGDGPAVEARTEREPFTPWQSAPFPSRAPYTGPVATPRASRSTTTRPPCAALVDPEGVAAALGLCEGVQGWGKRATWARIAGGVLVQCPAHSDHTASCGITRGADGTLRVRCFGCDLAGDVLHLVAAVYNLDVRGGFVRVLEHAAHVAGVRLSTHVDRPPVSPPPSPSCAAAPASHAQ